MHGLPRLVVPVAAAVAVAGAALSTIWHLDARETHASVASLDRESALIRVEADAARDDAATTGTARDATFATFKSAKHAMRALKDACGPLAGETSGTKPPLTTHGDDLLRADSSLALTRPVTARKVIDACLVERRS